MTRTPYIPAIDETWGITPEEVKAQIWTQINVIRSGSATVTTYEELARLVPLARLLLPRPEYRATLWEVRRARPTDDGEIEMEARRPDTEDRGDDRNLSEIPPLVDELGSPMRSAEGQTIDDHDHWDEQRPEDVAARSSNSGSGLRVDTYEALEEIQFVEAQAEFHARLVNIGMEPIPMHAICSTLGRACRAYWTYLAGNPDSDEAAATKARIEAEWQGVWHILEEIMAAFGARGRRDPEIRRLMLSQLCAGLNDHEHITSDVVQAELVLIGRCMNRMITPYLHAESFYVFSKEEEEDDVWMIEMLQADTNSSQAMRSPRPPENSVTQSMEQLESNIDQGQDTNEQIENSESQTNDTITETPNSNNQLEIPPNGVPDIADSQTPNSARPRTETAFAESLVGNNLDFQSPNTIDFRRSNGFSTAIEAEVQHRPLQAVLDTVTEAAALMQRRNLSEEERAVAQQHLLEAQLDINSIFVAMLDAFSLDRHSYEEQSVALMGSQDETVEAEPNAPNFDEGLEQISVWDSLDLSRRQEIIGAVESAYALRRRQHETGQEMDTIAYEEHMQKARDGIKQILESLLNAFRRTGRCDGTEIRELGISVQNLTGQYTQFFNGLNNGPAILVPAQFSQHEMSDFALLGACMNRFLQGSEVEHYSYEEIMLVSWRFTIASVLFSMLQLQRPILTRPDRDLGNQFAEAIERLRCMFLRRANSAEDSDGQESSSVGENDSDNEEAATEAQTPELPREVRIEDLFPNQEHVWRALNRQNISTSIDATAPPSEPLPIQTPSSSSLANSSISSTAATAGSTSTDQETLPPIEISSADLSSHLLARQQELLRQMQADIAHYDRGRESNLERERGYSMYLPSPEPKTDYTENEDRSLLDTETGSDTWPGLGPPLTPQRSETSRTVDGARMPPLEPEDREL